MYQTERPLTVQEAAEFLSVSSQAMRGYINQGLIKAHKIGVRGEDPPNTPIPKHPWRIYPNDLRAFIAQGVRNER
jgi:excisionase family DNA binding protein|tara:strand:+ start:622 stop:846 length:225 start_codon:yes stop_codon:yes gene_type:complete